MTMAVAQGDPDEEKYELIVKSYFADRLQRKGFNVPGYNNTTANNQHDQSNNNQHEIALTLRRVGDELEARNSEFFENMCNQLNITPDTAYGTFRTIADEIFSSETNWGRVVAFLTFGSTLAIHCASRNDMGFQYVDRIAGWVAKYMLNQLDNWIQQNGNWVSKFLFLM